MLKILFVIPTLGGGGAEKVLTTLVNGLDAKKYEITVFSIFDEGVNKMNLNKTVDYRFFTSKVFRGNIHVMKMFTPEFMYNFFIKQDYDIAISFLEGPATRIVSGCTNPKTTLYNWIHTEVNDKRYLLQSYRNSSEFFRCMMKYNKTVFVSHSAENAFRKTFDSLNIIGEVKYNPIDYENIIRMSKIPVEETDFDKGNNLFRIVSVGRYTKQKGYERLLEIVKRLKGDGEAVRLFLIGSGELENKYRKLCKLYGLEKEVVLMGYQENPYKFVKNSDLFVCSSYSEGFSTAVTEALVVGTPVVTTMCSGMEELLGQANEYGVITTNDEEGLYQGIKTLIHDRKLLCHYKKMAQKRSELIAKADAIRDFESLFDDFSN